MKRVIILLALLALPAYALEPQTFPTDSLIIETGGKKISFSIEVATTEAQHEWGLMFRKSMPKDHGMLFILDKPRVMDMWMKNTLIPLDMVFIDAHGTVIKIVKNATPESLDMIPSGGVVAAVMEINGGAADSFRITEGAHVHYHSVFQ